MTGAPTTPRRAARQGGLRMLLDVNLGLSADHGPVAEALRAAKVRTEQTADLDRLWAALKSHETDIAYVPSGQYHRLVAVKDRHYRAIAASASKFTGDVTLASLLVVRKDDPATGLDDLEGAAYGYINSSCSSTWYPAELLLQHRGRALASFFDARPVNPGATWEGLVQAVTSGTVRATMVLEDVWKTFPENAAQTKVIGRYDHSKGPVILVPADLNPKVEQMLFAALIAHTSPWEAVYGGFKPYYPADMALWFHELDALPRTEW